MNLSAKFLKSAWDLMPEISGIFGECLLVPSVFMAWLVSELHVHNAELKTQSEVTELTEEKIGQR